MENWGSDGIWRVGETTLWYVEGVAEGDNKIVAPDIPVKMDESNGQGTCGFSGKCSGREACYFYRLVTGHGLLHGSNRLTNQSNMAHLTANHLPWLLVSAPPP